jgi:putative ABC transport system permease protein
MRLRDLRYAFRSLRKSPGFVAVAVLSLGLGLGLVTTMFGLLDAVRNPYVPYAQPDRLFVVNGWFPSKDFSVAPFEVYEAVRDYVPSFGEVVASTGKVVSVAAGDQVDETVASIVPPRYFGVLGLRPYVGRVFRTDDAGRDVAVIGYEPWRQYFRATRKLAGLTLQVDGRAYAVVGVMPKGAGGGIWLPMSSEMERTGAAVARITIVARLRRGATAKQASADLDAVARRLTERYHAQRAPFGFQLYSMRGDPMRLKSIHKAMLGAALAVLLIACANLANLMLARGLAKRRELALRLAIGASRRAVVGQMFAEAVLLTVAGAALGVVLSLWGVDLLGHQIPRDMWWLGIVRPQLSWRVFALSAAATAAAAALFGLVPALRVARGVSLDEPLKDGAGTTGRTRGRYSRLVIGEVGLALVLLMGAGLLVKVVHRLATYDFDFPARQLLRVSTGAYRDSETTPEAQARIGDAVLTAVRGVRGALAVAQMGGLGGGAVTAELSGDSTRLLNAGVAVSPDFLRTVGLPILQGRDFMAGDVAGDGVAILNTAAAARLYPHQVAVGRMLKLGGPDSHAPWVRIVGVCRTARAVGWPDFSGWLEPVVYVARSFGPSSYVNLVVRTAGEDPAVALRIRRAVLQAAPRWYQSIGSYVSWYDTEMRSRAFLAQLFATMSAFALILAAVGCYGVLAYAVSIRSREFAVRIALGAGHSAIFKSVLHDGLVMTLAGTGLGGIVALWASGLLAGFLEDVPPTDAVALGSAEAVLIAVTVLACLGPALRAMRADPVALLRAT